MYGQSLSYDREFLKIKPTGYIFMGLIPYLIVTKILDFSTPGADPVLYSTPYPNTAGIELTET